MNWETDSLNEFKIKYLLTTLPRINRRFIAVNLNIIIFNKMPLLQEMSQNKCELRSHKCVCFLYPF